MDFTFKHPETGDVKVLSLSEEKIQDLLECELYEMVTECDCQPIGETNAVECNCIDHLENFELQPRT